MAAPAKFGTLEWMQWVRDAGLADGPISDVLEFSEMVEQRRDEDRVKREQAANHATRLKLYPWSYDLSAKTHEHSIEHRPTSTEQGDEGERWPYYFIRPRSVSALPGGSTRIHLLPATQQQFMQGICSRNLPLLKMWVAMVDTVFALVDRKEEKGFIAGWAHVGFTRIRSRLQLHPKAPSLADLNSLIPLVEEELRPSKPTAEMQADMDFSMTQFTADEFIRVRDWRFYQALFMPSPHRLGVPLPVGLVLFEGRSVSELRTILRDGIRRAPFSTTWHPNAAIHFVHSPVNNNGEMNVLLAHKLMSDGILGVDVQKGSDYQNSPAMMLQWNECEIIVQPLVRFHLVDEYNIAIEYEDLVRYFAERDKVKLTTVRIVMLHAYLGAECPCQATARAKQKPAQPPLM